MSKFLPNSFQTPNTIVDDIMEQVSGSEFKLLLFTIRHTYGWQDNKDRVKRISLTMYEKGYTTAKGTHFGGVGLSRPTIVNNLKSLVEKGLLVVEDEANADGRLWSVNFEIASKETLPSDDQGSKKTLLAGSKEILLEGSKESLLNKTHTKPTKTQKPLSPNGDTPSDEAIQKARNKQINEGIQAWLDNQKAEPVKSRNEYAIKYNRDIIGALLDKGLTPEHIGAFVKAKSNPDFYVSMTYINKNILGWHKQVTVPKATGTDATGLTVEAPVEKRKDPEVDALEDQLMELF